MKKRYKKIINIITITIITFFFLYNIKIYYDISKAKNSKYRELKKNIANREKEKNNNKFKEDKSNLKINNNYKANYESKKESNKKFGKSGLKNIENINDNDKIIDYSSVNENNNEKFKKINFNEINKEEKKVNEKKNSTFLNLKEFEYEKNKNFNFEEKNKHEESEILNLKENNKKEEIEIQNLEKINKNEKNNLNLNKINTKYNLETILNYEGGELEPEWEWVKNISFVYTWVDGSDIDFLDLKSKYNGGIREANSRDRSADELRYSLRSFEKYLPWHQGTIYIVTCQQIPAWLDTNNTKIKIVYHKDIFPEHIYPTFDSNTIELFLDKIPGITERFIYLNDDIFINNYIHPNFFFTNKTFYPKIYRYYRPKLNVNDIEDLIRKNNIHKIFQATKYFTQEIIREYFDSNFEYHDSLHTGHVFYRDLFEPFRNLFKEELKSICGNRLRNPYKPQVIYLYQTFLEYATKHKDFPMKLGGDGKAKYFEGYKLPSNRTVIHYSCEIQPAEISEKFIKFGKVTDNSEINNRYFNLFKTRSNILIFNLNDEYNKKSSFYELTEFMMTKFPFPSSFEKKEYVDLENSVYPLLINNTDNLLFNISNKYVDSELYNNNNNNNNSEEFKLNNKFNIIKDYLKKKEILSGTQKKISDREKEEIDFLINYKGEELTSEWDWVKGISVVYILENGGKNNITTIENIEKLKYSLRSLEKYLPWFEGKVFIITQKEISNNIFNLKNNRIKILNQNDIIPKTAHHTFNKHIIEMYLDKIPELSEKFIYLSVDHYFINYIHPRFFFNKEFYPIYNLKDISFDDKINEYDESFYYTYSIIMDYFGDTYVTNCRYLKNAPLPLYRDLFEPSRQLYGDYIEETINHKNYDEMDFLPIYMVVTYNIYGTEQPFYPDYVVGYGKIKNAKLPILNKNRTINYYGYDITSFEIAKSLMLLDISLNEHRTIIENIKSIKQLFFSLKSENNKQNQNLDIELINSDYLNNLKTLLFNIYSQKSSFEI